MRMRAFAGLFLLPFVLCACHDGGSAPAPQPPVAGRFVVTADTEVLTPDPVVPRFDLTALGDPGVDGAYRVTTPAGELFAFELVAWAEGAAGVAGVRLAHVADGGLPPQGGIESLARAGFVPSGSGLGVDGGWLVATGDGLARLTVSGIVTQPQVLAVAAAEGGVRLLEVAIGPRSAVNQIPGHEPDHPGVVSRTDLYSSDAACFGQPTLAISGDRTSVVVYEGDRSDPTRPGRYELRLQHDRATNAVTGGGVVEGGFDGGNWRDHECAALFNVLAVARSGFDGVLLRLSFDRGASFAQEVVLDTGALATRVVQLAIAADYTLALAWWRTAAGGELEFVVCEAAPMAFDGHGSPSWFRVGEPEVLHRRVAAGTPLTTGMAWSTGGDLVVGYGATEWRAWPVMSSVTEFRCAVRPHGGSFVDRSVDTEAVVARDPSVAVLGQGAGLRIVYAYEVSGGVRIAHSDDAGASFTLGDVVGGPGAWLPSVFARQRGAVVQVDVLYLAQEGAGNALRHSRWLDFPAGPREDLALTRAVLTPTPPHVRQLPGTVIGYDFGWRLTHVGWLGYDAVLDGDDLVVVYDEFTLDGAFACLAAPSVFRASTTGWFGPTTSNFRPATPPPLAPGMTEALPPPVAAHAHQLKLLRIE
jgi:hypothetical protein